MSVSGLEFAKKKTNIRNIWSEKCKRKTKTQLDNAGPFNWFVNFDLPNGRWKKRVTEPRSRLINGRGTTTTPSTFMSFEVTFNLLWGNWNRLIGGQRLGSVDQKRGTLMPFWQWFGFAWFFFNLIIVFAGEACILSENLITVFLKFFFYRYNF